MPGGITIRRMLLINAEGPSDGAGWMAHFTVSSAVGLADSVCAVVDEFVRDGLSIAPFWWFVLVYNISCVIVFFADVVVHVVVHGEGILLVSFP